MKPSSQGSRPKHVLMIVDWLPPDFGAVGQYGLGFARERAERGEHVTLLGLSSTKASLEEEAHGRGKLSVLRLHAQSVDKSRMRMRIAWMLKTNLRLVRKALPFLRNADEVVFTGSPPFMLFFLWPFFRAFKAKFTYRITDFHPECLMASMDRVPLVIRVLHWLTLVMRRSVHRFEAIGEDQKRRLLELGIDEDCIHLSRDPSPVSIPQGTKPLPIPAELEGKTILLYSGNFGVAHDVDTFVEGYRLHHTAGSGRVGLWLNATGVKADEVEQRIRSLGLPVHRSRPLPIEQLANLLVTPSAHLITLVPNFWGYVLPSKVYGCIESGRNVLYVGPVESDVHLLCRAQIAEGGYHHMNVGDAQALAHALEAIATKAQSQAPRA